MYLGDSQRQTRVTLGSERYFPQCNVSAPKGVLFTAAEHILVFLKVVQWFNLIRCQQYPFQMGLTFLCMLLQSRNAIGISEFLSPWGSKSSSGITHSFTTSGKSRDCEDKQDYLLLKVFLVWLHGIFQSSGQQTDYLLTKKTNNRVNHINQPVSLKTVLSFCNGNS